MGSNPHQCLWLYDLQVSAGTKRSAGVAPEVNLRNPLHTGNETLKQRSILVLKPGTNITRSSKQRYQWHHECGTYVLQKSIVVPYTSVRSHLLSSRSPQCKYKIMIKLFSTSTQHTTVYSISCRIGNASNLPSHHGTTLSQWPLLFINS